MIENRLDFINQINGSSEFNNYFDQFMSIYDVIKYGININYNSISYKTEDNNVILTLLCNNINDANLLRNNIDRVETIRYCDNSRCRLNINQNDNQLHIQFNRVSG